MDRGTLIRSYQAADLGFILHSRHQYHWHTGYAPPQTVAMPHIGAVISKTLGPKNPDVPAFIDIGQNLEIGGESAAVKAFHTAGFLGTDHGPFLITNPLDAGSSVRPLPELGDARFANRHELYEKLAAESPVAQIRRRVSARGAAAVGRRCASAAEFAVGQGVRSFAGTEAELRHLQHRAVRARLPAGAPLDGGRRAIHRSDHANTFRSRIGTRTRTGTRGRPG